MSEIVRLFVLRLWYTGESEVQRETTMERYRHLRRRAESALMDSAVRPKQVREGEADSNEHDPELHQLVRELDVHRIELEMQNDELRAAQLALDERRAHYCKLYDLAPFAYLVLDRFGKISDANLAAGDLLGSERDRLLGRPLSAFFERPQADALHQHLAKVFETSVRLDCYLTLAASSNGARPRTLVHIITVGVGGETQERAGCYCVMTKATEFRNPEAAERISDAYDRLAQSPGTSREERRSRHRRQIPALARESASRPYESPTGSRVIQVSAEQLREALARAESEGWTELAIVGSSWFLPRATHLSQPWRVYRTVYALTECIDIGECIGSLRRLSRLSLAGLRLGADGAEHIAALTNLTSLDLSGNQLGDHGAKHIAALTNLTSLDLSGNQLGYYGTQYISALTNLTSLDLSGNQLGDHGTQYISALTNLTSLDLSGNQLGDHDAKHIAALTNLASLDLSGNQLGDRAAKHIAALTNLTSLNLSGNQLGEHGAEHIAALTNLISLDLSGNHLGDEGAKHIAALTNLASLNLWYNQLGAEGAKHISALANLTSLGLSCNRIGDHGAKHISAMTNLTSLHLSNNQLGDQAAEHISAMTNLTSLSLSGNQIGDHGAEHISAMTNLTSLNLSDNQIGHQGIKHISAMRNLTSLNVWNNLGLRVNLRDRRASSPDTQR